MTPILGVIASSILKQAVAFDSIATINGTGSSNTITFSSIPSTYKSLQIRFISRNTGASTGTSWPQLTVNGATNYSRHYLIADRSSFTNAGIGSLGRIDIVNGQAGGGNSANIFTVGIIDIIDYASTTKNKTVRYITGTDTNAGGNINIGSGYTDSTTAINSITILGIDNNATTTSTFALYGIKG